MTLGNLESKRAACLVCAEDHCNTLILGSDIAQYLSGLGATMSEFFDRPLDELIADGETRLSGCLFECPCGGTDFIITNTEDIGSVMEMMGQTLLGCTACENDGLVYYELACEELMESAVIVSIRTEKETEKPQSYEGVQLALPGC